MPHEPEPAQDTQIYVRFVFPQQQQARVFMVMIDEMDWQVRLAYVAERDCWRATVTRTILIFPREATIWLATLMALAATVGGAFDGGEIYDDA